MLKQKVHEHLKNFEALSAQIVRLILCSSVFLATLLEINTQAVDKKREKRALIDKMLVKRRAPDHRLLAKHGDGYIFVGMLFEQFCKRFDQCFIGLLNSKVHC